MGTVSQEQEALQQAEKCEHPVIPRSPDSKTSSEDLALYVGEKWKSKPNEAPVEVCM